MIAKASSIRFIQSDGLTASLNNTLFNNLPNKGLFPNRYYQKIYSTDTITLQAMVTNGYTIKVYYSEEDWGPWTLIGTGTLETDGTSYDYYEQEIDFSTLSMSYVSFKVEVYTAVPALSETWYSEPFEILTESDDDLRKI